MNYIQKNYRNRIVDYIWLPTLLDADYETIDFTISEKEAFAEIFSDLRQVKSLLEPFKDKIKRFFRGQPYRLFMDSLYRHLLDEGIDPKNMTELYEALLNLSQEEISRVFVAMLTDGKQETITDDELFQLIEKNTNEADRRWQVIWTYHHLKECVTGMIAFYKEVLPLYLPYYQHYQEEIDRFSETLDIDKLYQNAEDFSVRSLLQQFGQKNCYVFVRSPLHLNMYTITNTNNPNNPSYLAIHPRIGTLIESRSDFNDEVLSIALKILSDPVRYEILKLIHQGVYKHKNIAEQLAITSANVSFHIGKLLDANLLTITENTKQKYKISNRTLNNLLSRIRKDFDLDS